jgi:ribosomal protein L29
MAEPKTVKKTAAKKPAAKAVKPAVEVKTLEQLRVELATKQLDQIGYKRSHAAGELVNPRVLTHTRKEIARLHTAIRAAELAEQKESK